MKVKIGQKYRFIYEGQEYLGEIEKGCEEYPIVFNVYAGPERNLDKGIMGEHPFKTAKGFLRNFKCTLIEEAPKPSLKEMKFETFLSLQKDLEEVNTEIKERQERAIFLQMQMVECLVWGEAYHDNELEVAIPTGFKKETVGDREFVMVFNDRGGKFPIHWLEHCHPPPYKNRISGETQC